MHIKEVFKTRNLAELGEFLNQGKLGVSFGSWGIERPSLRWIQSGIEGSLTLSELESLVIEAYNREVKNLSSHMLNPIYQNQIRLQQIELGKGMAKLIHKISIETEQLWNSKTWIRQAARMVFLGYDVWTIGRSLEDLSGSLNLSMFENRLDEEFRMEKSRFRKEEKKNSEGFPFFEEVLRRTAKKFFSHDFFFDFEKLFQNAANLNQNPVRNVKKIDPYAVLGVGSQATSGEIGKAYRKLALKLHPDKNPDDRKAAGEKFQKLQEAYELLNDPKRRTHFDRFGIDLKTN